MFSDTFPSGTILFEFLFLLIAIALEALIFQYRLNFSQRTSVAYAASINLFSTVVGWLIFFCAEPLLPGELRTGLFNYIFFGRFTPLDQDVQSFLLLLCVSIFFASFVFKLVALQLLELVLKYPQKKNVDKVGFVQRRRLSSGHARENQEERSGSTALLLGNACSYSVILLILFVCANRDSFPD